MPEATLINVNCPNREPEGIEVTKLGKRIYNDELKLVKEERRPPPLRDLRLAARLRGDRGHRPQRGRGGEDRGHPDPLRPHRPRRARAVARLGLRGDAGRERSDGVSASAEQRVAALRRELARHNHLYYVLDDPEIGDDAYDELLNELRGLEEEHPESAHAGLADPAGGGAAAGALRSGRALRADALARQRPQRGGAAGLGDPDRQLPQALGHNRIAVQLHDRAEDRRARRSPSPTRTGYWSAAPPVATAASART